MVCDEDRVDYLVDFYSKSNRLSLSIFTVIVIDIVTEPFVGGSPIGEGGLGERRRFAGTSSRSPSTTYVHSVCTRRNPSQLKLHYFPVTLFTHQNAAHGIGAVLARV